MTKRERELRDKIVRAALDWEAAGADDDDACWDALDRLSRGAKRLRRLLLPQPARGRPHHAQTAVILADVKAGGLSAIEIAKRHGCHRNTVYRVKADAGAANGRRRE